MICTCADCAPTQRADYRSCKTCKAFKTCNIVITICAALGKVFEVTEPNGRIHDTFGYDGSDINHLGQVVNRKRQMLLDDMYDIVGNSCSMFVE